jgi:hypothetical protein
MAPTARRCAGCGGPLPDTAPGVTSITCQFCGIVNDLPADASKPAVVHIDIGKATAQVGRTVRWVGLAVVAMVGVGIAVPVWLAMRPVATAINEVRTAVGEVEKHTPVRTPPVVPSRSTASARAKPIAPADLATVSGGGWREVDAPAPPGGWATIDPVRGMEWAMSIARGWAPDARLTRVDVERVSAAGVADVSTAPDEAVGYRFVSPARIVEWEKRAERELKAETGYELMMRAVAGKLTANVIVGRPPKRELPARAPDSLPLADVLARARKTGRFADYPFYSGYLIYLEREGWVWYLNSLSRRESIPRVRARDGAVYPYRAP